MLVEIAKRLQTHVRPEDVAGRLGGDEFVILINNIYVNEQLTQDIAVQIGGKLIELIKSPIVFKGSRLTLGASIGVRLLGFDTLDTETALRQADIAMYRAKQSGGDCVVCFER